MDLSIIIPCHDIAHCIRPLLVSLKLQLLGEIKAELIFICDACTDNTKDVITTFEFGGQWTDIKCIITDVHSCGIARNVGIDHATGGYIWFIDGDDWLKTPLAIAKFMDMSQRSSTPVFRFEYESPGFKAHGYFSMVWQYGYKRDFISDIPFDNIQPAEDDRFNTKVKQKLLPAQIPMYGETLYHYNYMRPGSNMHQFTFKGHIE